MKFLFVFAAAIVSVGIMFLIAKLVGYRQISDLSMYDYINSITLGSIAADLAISPTLDTAVYCVIGMVVYGTFTLLFSVVSAKSKRARQVIEGSPLVLMQNGQLYRESFKKAKLDLDEFLSICRVQGYFDPFNIDTALLEANGNISIIPKPSEKPVVISDLNLTAPKEKICSNVIMDGRILSENLSVAGYNEDWLKKELKTVGYNSSDKIFLAYINKDGKLNVFPCNDEEKRSSL